jgi:hypothetical protein
MEGEVEEAAAELGIEQQELAAASEGPAASAEGTAAE